MGEEDEVIAAVRAAVPKDADIDDAYQEYIVEAVRSVLDSVTGTHFEPALYVSLLLVVCL